MCPPPLYRFTLVLVNHPLSPRVLSFKSELAHPLVPTCLLFFNRAHPPSIELLAWRCSFLFLSFRLNYFPSLRSFRFNARIVINRFERKRKKEKRDHGRSERDRFRLFLKRGNSTDILEGMNHSVGSIFSRVDGRVQKCHNINYLRKFVYLLCAQNFTNNKLLTRSFINRVTIVILSQWNSRSFFLFLFIKNIGYYYYF